MIVYSKTDRSISILIFENNIDKRVAFFLESLILKSEFSEDKKHLNPTAKIQRSTSRLELVPSTETRILIFGFLF